MIATRLKKLRGDLEISQAKLANILGLPQQTYADWETGKNEPNATMLYRLADFFDVTVDYLIGRSNDVSQSNSVQIGNGSKQSQFNGTFNIGQKNKK